MRLRLLAAVAAAVLGAVSVAIAAHVPQVDPATVPTGFLATHNNAADVPQGSLRRIARARGGIDTFVQHVPLTRLSGSSWNFVGDLLG